MQIAPRVARAVLFLAIVWSLLTRATLAAEPPPAIYQPDWTKIATLMVERSLELAPGERVIIHHDPARDPELVAALRTAIVKAGGFISGELTWPDQATGSYLAALSPAQRKQRGEAERALYRDLFARADVYLWLHASPYDDLLPRQFEHLIGASKVRAIHSHWFEPADAAERDAVRRMYEAALNIDPRELEALQAPLEAQLRGAIVHLTSPQGTDLTFRIPRDAWFHCNTGKASRAKVARARSVRDREEELPAGVLRTTAVVGASGRLVARLLFGGSEDGVDVTFRAGRIVKIEPRGEAGKMVANWFATVTGDRDQISELVIGTNPSLTPILPSGFMPYYGYGAGVIRIAIGENWESGGTLRTSDSAEQWLFVTDGSMTANGVVIIEDGELRE